MRSESVGKQRHAHDQDRAEQAEHDEHVAGRAPQRAAPPRPRRRLAPRVETTVGGGVGEQPRRRRSAHGRFGGRRAAHGRAVSNAAEAWSTVRSSKRRPTICNPIGMPAAVNPAGTVAAGWPVKLNGYENDAHGNQSHACWGKCAGFSRPTSNAVTETLGVSSSVYVSKSGRTESQNAMLRSRIWM